MILLLIKILVYYVLLGSVFTLIVSDKIIDIIEIMKETSDKIKNISDKKIRRTMVIMFTTLWPLFLYRIFIKSR